MKRKCYEILGLDPKADKCRCCPVMEKEERAFACWLYAMNYCHETKGLDACVACKCWEEYKKGGE